MRSDDTAPLFSGDPNNPTPVSLRQGVVQSWNPATGENSIQIAGGTLVNLPALTSESATLAAGDVVALLTDGSKWLLVGKVTTPGDPGTVPSWVGDITALAPLTDLAAVTTGLTMTGATNVTTDPGDGAHVVVNDPAYPGEIALFSGNPGEITPARVRPDSAGLNYGALELRSPDLTGGGYAFIELDGFDDGTTTATIEAIGATRVTGDNLTLVGSTQVRIGDGTDYVKFVGQAVTDADLSSLTNTFPTFPYYSAYLAAAANVTTGTSTAVSWTDDATAPSSGITRSGSVFTVPTAGRYRVTFQAYWAAIASPAGTRLAQLITGNTIGSGTALASAAEQPSATAASACLITKTIRLAASAQFRTQVSHTQGGVTPVSLQGNATGDLTYVQIEWVGP